MEHSSDGDLDILAPASITLDYNGASLEVRPVTVGQLPQFVRHVRNLLGLVEALDSKSDAGESEPDEEQVMEAILAHYDDVLALCAFVTEMPVEIIKAGQLDELVNLVTAIIRVNKDFFIARLAPALRAALGSINGTGPTPSSS